MSESSQGQVGPGSRWRSRLIQMRLMKIIDQKAHETISGSNGLGNFSRPTEGEKDFMSTLFEFSSFPVNKPITGLSEIRNYCRATEGEKELMPFLFDVSSFSANAEQSESFLDMSGENTKGRPGDLLIQDLETPVNLRVALNELDEEIAQARAFRHPDTLFSHCHVHSGWLLTLAIDKLPTYWERLEYLHRYMCLTIGQCNCTRLVKNTD